MNEVFVTDLKDSVNAVLYLYEHLEEAAYRDLIKDFKPFKAVEHIGLAVHASP